MWVYRHKDGLQWFHGHAQGLLCISLYQIPNVNKKQTWIQEQYSATVSKICFLYRTTVFFFFQHVLKTTKQHWMPCCFCLVHIFTTYLSKIQWSSYLELLLLSGLLLGDTPTTPPPQKKCISIFLMHATHDAHVTNTDFKILTLRQKNRMWRVSSHDFLLYSIASSLRDILLSILFLNIYEY